MTDRAGRERSPGLPHPAELAAENARLRREISQLKRAEGELVRLKDELSGELAAMTRLHEFSSRLLANPELSPLLEEVLTATIALQRADCGFVQLHNPSTRELEIVAESGFELPVFESLGAARMVGAPYERALLLGERVMIPDMQLDAGCEAHFVWARAAGFQAAQSTPLLGPSGEPLGALTTYFRRPHRPSELDLRLTDLYAQHAAQVIARKRTDIALSRSQFYLNEGERLSHTGSWVWSAKEAAVSWSDESYRILGLEPGSVPPSAELFWQAIDAKEREPIRLRFEHAVRARADFDEQYRVVRVDGQVRHVHCRSRPFFNEFGELVEYVGTMMDITERRQADEALRQAQAELMHVMRVMTMGELSASIAHEVNQPLAAVKTSADACVRWLALHPPNVQEAMAAARSVSRDAHRASEVITRIRALLTRSEPHKTELRVEDAIREVVSLVQGEARSHHVSLLASTAANLPAVVGDRIQLQQVILNLAVNAIEAMRAIEERPRVLDIAAELHDDVYVKILVRDNGPGLEPQHRDRIFDAFYTTKSQGMGMGLAICRSIVDAHGGRLWVAANAELGETFQFTFPIARSARAGSVQ